MILTVQGQPAYAYTGGKPFDATLPTTVFIHGAEHDHSVWALQTRYFAHHGFGVLGVLAVDLPGHNRSSGPVRTTRCTRWPTGLPNYSTPPAWSAPSSRATAWAR